MIELYIWGYYLNYVTTKTYVWHKNDNTPKFNRNTTLESHF